MISCKKTYSNNVRCFSSVNEISNEIWQQLGCEDNLYFNSKYLLTIAKHHPYVEFIYIVLFDKAQKAVALATIQLVDFYLDGMQNNTQVTVEKIKCVGKKLRLISSEKPFRILVSGNVFVSGEHGIFIKDNQNKKTIINQLANAIVHLVNSNKNYKKTINAFMLKDFTEESLPIVSELLALNYHTFSVEPNMLMKIDFNWASFEDYLADMRTKFRVKAKKAMQLSATLKVVAVTAKNIDGFLPEITKLYKVVCASSGFNLCDFNPSSYKMLKEQLGENYIIKTYFLNDKMVGFLSGMINQNSLDAHFVGLDYQYNKNYAVYQRILYDYINLAIQKRLNSVNFGRTASEIKSSVGAVPQDLTIYLRHKQTIPNVIIKPFLKRIQPTPFRQNMPFKAKNLAEKV